MTLDEWTTLEGLLAAACTTIEAHLAAMVARATGIHRARLEETRSQTADAFEIITGIVAAETRQAEQIARQPKRCRYVPRTVTDGGRGSMEESWRCCGCRTLHALSVPVCNSCGHPRCSLEPATTSDAEAALPPPLLAAIEQLRAESLVHDIPLVVFAQRPDGLAELRSLAGPSDQVEVIQTICTLVGKAVAPPTRTRRGH